MIYYLKCQNCEFLNEVKTEYLTLCSNCGSRLHNSYRSWALEFKNQGKTFEDYKKEVCISQQQLDEQQLLERKRKKAEKRVLHAKNEKNKKNLRRILAFAVAILVPVLVYFTAIYFAGSILLTENVTSLIAPVFIYIPDLLITIAISFINVYLLFARKTTPVFILSGINLLLVILVNLLIYRAF